MLKKSFATLIILLIAIGVNAQQNWVKQKFGERLTLNFPAETKKVGDFTYLTKDSTGTVYGVVIMEIDPSAYKTTLSTDTLLTRLKFIDEVVASVKTKMPKYAIGDVKIKEKYNIKNYLLEGLNTENKSTVYLNIFLVGRRSE